MTRILFALLALGALWLVDGCADRPEDRLVAASGGGDVQEIQRLLSLGVNVNCVSHTLDKFTPLILAVNQRQVKAVAVLLTAGADPNMHDAHKKAALYYAYSYEVDLSAFIKLLILAGANTEEYKALFETLPENNLNRIAFEEAIKEKSRAKRDGKP